MVWCVKGVGHTLLAVKGLPAGRRAPPQPSMTMVFRADPDMIARMSEGQDIEFVAEPVKGKLTVTQMK